MRQSREEILKEIREYVNEPLTGIKVEYGKCSELYIELRVTYIPFGEPFKTRCSLTRTTLDVTGTEQDPGMIIFAQDIAQTCFDMDDKLNGVDVVLVKEMAEV